MTTYEDILRTINEPAFEATAEDEYKIAYTKYKNTLALRFDALIRERGLTTREVAEALYKTDQARSSYTRRPGPGTALDSENKAQTPASRRMEATISRSRKPGASLGKGDADNSRLGYGLSAMMSAMLCYDQFNMSVHEFLSGEAPTFQLPKHLAVAVRRLMAVADESMKDGIFEDIKAYVGENPGQYQFEGADTMLITRFKELQGDKGGNYEDVLKTQRVSVLLNMKQLMEKETRSRGPFLKNLIYIAAVTGVPVDYYLVRNYLQHADIVYQPAPEDSATMVPLTDKTVRLIIEHILYLPSEKQDMALAWIVQKVGTWAA